MRISVITLILAMWVVGCASNQSVNDANNSFFSGETHADSKLRSDTTNMIKTIVKARGCSSIDHIDAKVLHYEPSNGQKGHVWGQEGWMVTGCGKPYPFLVSFTEDGNGGTFFGLKPVQR